MRVSGSARTGIIGKFPSRKYGTQNVKATMAASTALRRQHAATRRRTAEANTTVPGLFDDPPGILVLPVLARPPRPSPHLQICPRQEPARRRMVGHEPRQVDPRHGRVFVVRLVPVVV